MENAMLVTANGPSRLWSLRLDHQGGGWPPVIPDQPGEAGMDWSSSVTLPAVFTNLFFWPVKKQVQVWMAGNRADEEAEHCTKRGPSQ